MVSLTDLAFVDPHRVRPGALTLPSLTIRATAPRAFAEPEVTDPAQLPVWIAGAGQRWRVTEWLAATHTTSLLVLRRDASIAFEWYGQSDDAGCDHASLFLGASATKSVLATLVGDAVRRRQLSLADSVVDHVPELRDTGYAKVRVLHLITMTSGVDWLEDYRDPGSPAVAMLGSLGTGELRPHLAAIKAGVDPGSRWTYNTADSQVLDWVRERATNATFAAHLQELWGRIAAENDARVATDASGVAFAGGGLAATTRDWARLGLLALTGTDARQEPLLAPEWIAESFRPADEFTRPGTLPASITSLLGFGRHWWHYRAGVALADGSRGQFVYVDTVRGLVLVKTSLFPYDDPLIDRQARELSIVGLAALADHVSPVPSHLERNAP